MDHITPEVCQEVGEDSPNEAQFVLLPELEKTLPDPKPKPAKHDLFLCAYHTKDEKWRVFDDTYESTDQPSAVNHARKLRQNGYRKITFLRLPQALWETESHS